MFRFDRIKVDPEVMNGQACIRDTRITVSLVLRLLAKHNMQEVLEMYPELEEEDIKQALEYASYLASEKIITGRGHILDATRYSNAKVNS